MNNISEMIISKEMKEQTIVKLKSLLKYYLVNEFEQHGYDFKEKKFNKLRSKEAKIILKTINHIQQNKDIEKKLLEKLFNMYEIHHNGKRELWKI